jgi:4-hydroxyphenylacetate 3-monooxygenase
MVMGLDIYSAYDAARAKALSQYYAYARDNDLYVTYVVIDPLGVLIDDAGRQRR